MKSIQDNTVMKVGESVVIKRNTEKSYSDEGKILSLMPFSKLEVRITKSKLDDVIGKSITFVYVNNVWRYLNDGTYSTRDPGYSIEVIKSIKQKTPR